MSYEQQIAKAPGTNPELMKAALIEIVCSIEERLSAIESRLEKHEESNAT